MSSKPNNATSYQIVVFSDGACKGNPGPGGWGAIVCIGDEVRELGAGEALTTNNIMELTGVACALLFVERELARLLPKSAVAIQVYSDSKYVLQGASSWRNGWKRAGWKKQDGTPVANLRQWQELDALIERLAVRASLSWTYVEGHAGIPGNERCDAIAEGFALGHHVELYDGPADSYSVDLSRLVPTQPRVKKTSSSSGPPEAGFPIYLSYVNGKLQEHRTWPECQAVVHGRAGAKFKKVNSNSEKSETLRSWNVTDI